TNKALTPGRELAISTASKPSRRNFPLAYPLMGLPGSLANRRTPAGSMLFYQTLMVLRPSVAVSERFCRHPARYFVGSQSRHQVSNAPAAVYIVPVGLTFID